MNERSSNSKGCSMINGISNASEVTNMIKAWFRNSRNVLRKVRLLSKMTPKLGAERTGDRVTLLGRWMIGLLSFESCWGRPTKRNSFLEGLRERKLHDIQLLTLVIVSSRWEILYAKSAAENDKKSWWFADKLDMTVPRGVVYKMKRRGPRTDSLGTP